MSALPAFTKIFMMKIEPIILEGEYVRLEPLQIEHLENLCEVGFEESIWHWMTVHIKTKNEMQKYIEAALDEQKRGISLPFVTIEKSSGVIVLSLIHI